MEKGKSLISKMLKRMLSREFMAYAVFGVLTTAVNIVVFKLLLNHAGIAYGIANIIAVLSAKAFAYVTNKLFVFRSRCASLKALLIEILKFVFARGFTGLIDVLGMLFAVEILKADEMMAKYVIQVIVILLNYVLGRKVVFGRGRSQTTQKAA